MTNKHVTNEVSAMNEKEGEAMALGELIGEWKGKITSVKVHPFEGSGQGVKVEQTFLAELSGRLSGREMGTYYGVLAPDGTASGTYYGVLTTNEGETVLSEGRAAVVPIGPGRYRVHAIDTYKTTSQKLAWLNTTVTVFEGEGDLSEVAGKSYEWK